MKKTVIMTLTLILLAVIISCSQWNVSNLGMNKYALIPAGEKGGQVQVLFEENVLKDLSFGVGIYDGKIALADNNMKRFQVLQKSGKIDLVIGSLRGVDTKKVKGVPFKFGTIGSFTIDRDDNIYIQNRLPSAPRRRWSREKSMNFSPSFILVFNEDGKLQYTLGTSGTPDIPFYYIDHLAVDDQERLFVISRSFDTWSVYRFVGKKRDFYINLNTLKFQEKEGNDIFKGEIENVKVYRSGEVLMISVAYYHDRRLKYRKVYEYTIQGKRLQRPIVNIPDPKNVLFSVVDDRHIYFWNMEENESPRFMIVNMDGNIINNVQLTMDNSRYYYTGIFGDLSGKFYSYHVNKKGILINEWE